MAESQCSGPCNSLRRPHVVRAHLTLTLYCAWTLWSPKKRGSSPSCQTDSASAPSVKGSFHHRVCIQTSVSLWYRLIMPSICSRTKRFSSRTFCSKTELFELLDVRKPRFDCICIGFFQKAVKDVICSFSMYLQE